MTLNLDLTDNKEDALKALALSQGVSAEQIRTADCRSRTGAARVPAARQAPRRISQRIAEIMADIPREEFAKLPTDGARHVDHYVYGLPKKD